MSRRVLDNSDVEASLARLRRGMQRANVPAALNRGLRALPNLVGHDDPDCLEVVSDSRMDTDRPAVRGPALATSYLLSYAGATFDVAIDVVRSSGHRLAELRGVVIGTAGLSAPHEILIDERRIPTDVHGQFRIENVGDGQHLLRIAKPQGSTVATLSVTVD